MNLIQTLKNKFFIDWFPNWSPDIALRYIPIIKLLQKGKVNQSIIDVGSGSLGITPYLRREITGVDINFDGPKSKLLKRVKSPANKLPFLKNTFEIGLCVDVLEHIPKNSRGKVIQELLRVVNGSIYIVVPCGPTSVLEDKYLYDFVFRTTKRRDPYLREHFINQLPSVKEIIDLIPHPYTVKVMGLTNIYLHRLLMIIQFSNNRFLKFISSVVFVTLIPLFLKINIEPTYRKLFIISKEE